MRAGQAGVSSWLWRCGVPPHLVGARFDNYAHQTLQQAAALQTCAVCTASWLEAGGQAPAGLWLHGPEGTGKSHLAVAVAAGFVSGSAGKEAGEWLRHGTAGRATVGFWRAGQVATRQTTGLWWEMGSVRLLVLDGLDSVRVDAAAARALLRLLQLRRRRGVPTVVTSLCHPAELAGRHRLPWPGDQWQEWRVVPLDGSDYCRKNWY